MTDATNIPATSKSLPIALLRAREKVMGPIRHMLADAGVTEQQWRVLRVLMEEGPLDPTTIADRAVLLLPSLTRILQKLEEKEYVTRTRDEVDRRRQVISVAEKGHALIAKNMPESQRHARALREQLGDERYSSLLDLLDDLNKLDL
ncbi:MAG: homoprotocatechuate degradation operon regulator HpaR [Tateyamaria sp.]|uniref:homoprotocatechuate degradation operon regulator HpaR n=1 Tax=Roseobacteraceae TaxID=2854170 RepID=UPI003299E7DC